MPRHEVRRPARLPPRWLRGLIVFASITLACRRGADPPLLVLEGVTIVDGSGADPIPNGRIVIRGGRIEAVGPSLSVSIPRGAQRLDLTGKWVVPGLVDLHTHPAPWAFSRFVAWGVTTVRALHADSATASAVHEAANLGGFVAPRVFSTGAAIDGPPAWPQGAVEVTEPSAARRVVDAQLLAGRDWIEAQAHLTPDLFTAIVDEASQLRIPVAANLGFVDAVTAARVGVRTIEHLSGVVDAALPDSATRYRTIALPNEARAERTAGWAAASELALDSVAAALAAMGTFVVPTLVAHPTLGSAWRALPSELTRTVPDSVVTAWRNEGLALRPPAQLDSATLSRARANRQFFLRRLREAGGLVGAGTDTPRPGLVPGASLHEELERLVAAGLTPAEALRAATMDAALALDADSLGRIAPGRVADLLVLEGDPLTDIRNLRRIGLVILRGNPTDPRDLRRTW